ncbi:HNH endonuclease [Caballeronia jiangsuensis]|uniref:HNH endonuclease n=1 Tax=Caballeronia jiangsuensis TaxID=1458357 RepID=UPI0038B8EF27
MELKCPFCVSDLPSGYYRHSNGTVVNRHGKPVSTNTLNRVKAKGKTARLADWSGGADQKRRDEVKQRAKYCCAHCGRATATGTVDHVIPLHKDGPDTLDNLQWLCPACDRKKTATDKGHVYRAGSNLDGIPVDIDHHWNN